jgi:hypothetical protein
MLSAGPVKVRCPHYGLFMSRSSKKLPITGWACQRRVKTAHSWRVKIAHFERGDEPQCVSASFFLDRRAELV